MFGVCGAGRQGLTWKCGWWTTRASTARWTWSTPFPWVKLIANEDNVGFSVANNQAIRKSSGKHVLLLNPDTVVREDTFAKGLEHMEAHPNVGGMGVPMYDGTGKYLPESKRGLPTPWVAFCRMAGLHRFAPTSEQFNAYYAGHLGDTTQDPSTSSLAPTCGCARRPWMRWAC